MYYEINVTLNGRHFFATAERSIQSRHELDIAYKVFNEKFPESEGYGLIVTEYEKIGTQVDMNGGE